MAALTVAQIKTRVKRKFGDEAGTQISDSDIVSWINDAQKTIVSQNDSLLEKSATTDQLDGVQGYTLPIDLLKFRGMSYKGTADIAYNIMKGMTVNEFNMHIDSWDQNTSQKGVPAVYCITEGKFLVFPIPQGNVTAAFKLYYCRRPTDVAIDTDVPDLPELYHIVIVDLVLRDAYELDENWNAAEAKSKQSNMEIGRLKGSEEWTIRETYPVISIRPEDL